MRMLGSKKESGLEDDAGSGVVASTVDEGTRPLALVEEAVGTVGTFGREEHELVKISNIFCLQMYLDLIVLQHLTPFEMLEAI